MCVCGGAALTAVGLPQDRRENVARLRRLEERERERMAQQQAEERRAEEEAARRREYVRQQRQEFLKDALQKRHQIQEAVQEMRITKRWRPIKLPRFEVPCPRPFSLPPLTRLRWCGVMGHAQHRGREPCRGRRRR